MLCAAARPDPSHRRERGEQVLSFQNFDGFALTARQLSLSTLAASSSSFFDFFKHLVEQADQADSAFGSVQTAGKSAKAKDDEKDAAHWINAATTPQTHFDVKSADEALKNRTYLVEGKLTAADVAVFGTVHPYIVSVAYSI